MFQTVCSELAKGFDEPVVPSGSSAVSDAGSSVVSSGVVMQGDPEGLARFLCTLTTEQRLLLARAASVKQEPEPRPVASPQSAAPVVPPELAAEVGAAHRLASLRSLASGMNLVVRASVWLTANLADSWARRIWSGIESSVWYVVWN